MFEPSQNLGTNEKTEKICWSSSNSTASLINGKERKNYVLETTSGKNSNCIVDFKIETKDLSWGIVQKNLIRKKVINKRKIKINSKDKIEKYELNERSLISPGKVDPWLKRSDKESRNVINKQIEI